MRHALPPQKVFLFQDNEMCKMDFSNSCHRDLNLALKNFQTCSLGELLKWKISYYRSGRIVKLAPKKSMYQKALIISPTIHTNVTALSQANSRKSNCTLAFM